MKLGVNFSLAFDFAQGDNQVNTFPKISKHLNFKNNLNFTETSIKDIEARLVACQIVNAYSTKDSLTTKPVNFIPFYNYNAKDYILDDYKRFPTFKETIIEIVPAVYFKENELISSQKQDVQLVRLKKKLQLRIIANQSKDIANMPFEERKLLTELQTSLYKEVIEAPFELVICNDKFEPIFNLNE